MTMLLIWAGVGVAAFLTAFWLTGVRYIPHQKVGVIEKLWSSRGSLQEGRIIASNGEAGFQTRILRGGMQFRFFPWQFRIHEMPLVTVAEGRIGYVYARDGAPLQPTQTLGHVVESNYFQDADAFIRNGGQRGRQRAILREGVFAINPALFVVLTEDRVYVGPGDRLDMYVLWQQELHAMDGFRPIVIGAARRGDFRSVQPVPPPPATSLPPSETREAAELLASDTVGVVAVHDGPTIASGEIIAPEIVAPFGESDHNYFQDTERFLELGGKRGRQLQVLTDGTFFINRWFASIEIKPKTLIPIGFVGVVVSYYGAQGSDVTGKEFRYGEQVEPGERGVWKKALPPGKYALNPYALKVEHVPTVNFVLRWITGQTEAHQYDKELASIAMITADGYEPMLPLSLVLHIDYQKAPSVIQRFGDVRRLITQTLDPVLTAYFRDVAQSSNMLDLLTHREEIQKRATLELGRRFTEFDINCVAVLIGRPESSRIHPGGVDPIETLFDQLRVRRLAQEQRETYGKQQEAAQHLKELRKHEAAAEKERELTQSRIEIEISGNRGEAQLAEAQQLAKRDVALAEGQAQSKKLFGEGEASRITKTGLAEAAVFLQKIKAYGDARLFALNHLASEFSKSSQPLVPERVFLSGQGGGKEGEGNSLNLLNTLIELLVSDKSGIRIEEGRSDLAELEKVIADAAADKATKDKPRA
ncbi:MAG: hypothetical protein JWL59_2549 [Chthoniobacteraceae bacterium]|nr:hypothetical protein [Chthoniobacteraceae bacterium]